MKTCAGICVITLGFLSLPASALLAELGDVARVDVGGHHACALTGAGAVLCWGNNASGELGDGTTASRITARQVAGLSAGALAVATSRSGDFQDPSAHSCAITASGAVKCWGGNAHGQLGDGTKTNRLLPVDVALPAAAIAISAGRAHTCVLLAGGAVQCWGDNRFNQLGDGTDVQRLLPTPVSGLSTGIARISAGASHTCAVTAAGAAKCWGSNFDSESIPGAGFAITTPTEVPGLGTGVIEISAASTVPESCIISGPMTCTADVMPKSTINVPTTGSHSCALTSAGGAKCWGAIPSGSFPGNGTPSFVFDVSGLDGPITAIATGGTRFPASSALVNTRTTPFACAVTTSGAVKCWGDDFCGSLGRGGVAVCDGSIVSTLPAPGNVIGVAGVEGIATGGASGCAVQGDGHVKCWGLGYATTAVPVYAETLPQTITVDPVAPVAIGGTGTLSANGGGSGNPVVFTSLTAPFCTISGTTVTGVSAGLCFIRADQAGDGVYDPANHAFFEVRIGDLQSQTITFGPLPALTVEEVRVLGAAASSNLPVALTVIDGPCALRGAVVTAFVQGSCTIAANQPGNALYAAAPQVTQTFAVGAYAGILGFTVIKEGDGTGLITSSPAAIHCGLVCGANFSQGAQLSLSVVPDADSVFEGWISCGPTPPPVAGLLPQKSPTCASPLASSVAIARLSRRATVPRVSNISTRGLAGTGAEMLIGGFVIGGSTDKTVVIRARGPSLEPFGIANALPNPRLALVRSSDQATIAENDDWQTAANAGQLLATGFAPPHAQEAALLVTLPPGAYTALVSNVYGGSGVGIVEVFAVDAPEAPLLNISTRGQVLTGNDVLIGGFVVQGSGPKTVVVRARGPSLTAFGVPNALADPQLQIIRSSDQAVMATNDNWQNGVTTFGVVTSGFAPSEVQEAAVGVTLEPGAYTAIVSGAKGSTGIAIVEVFVLP